MKVKTTTQGRIKIVYDDEGRMGSARNIEDAIKEYALAVARSQSRPHVPIPLALNVPDNQN